ncbi:MAG: N-acetylneuraminate synthase family protein [Phenylobacterium sp.]
MLPKINIVAEVGCNHQGNFNLAIEMIKIAKLCNADYIKFQKRNCVKAVPKHMHDVPHPCPQNSFGETYLQHREALEFTIDQHRELKKYCESIGIKYACSVWDIDSANDIISLRPDYIKIPSALNYNFELLDYIFNNYDGDIHISFGMITRDEINSLITYLSHKKDKTVAYWTTSGYPVKFEELYLLEIDNLKKQFNEVGYSGHNLGIAVDMAAIVLGCTWIERHFTLDRTAKGTDNAASLEPTGLSKLVRDANAVCKSLQHKNIDLTNDEKNNRKKLKQ